MLALDQRYKILFTMLRAAIYDPQHACSVQETDQAEQILVPTEILWDAFFKMFAALKATDQQTSKNITAIQADISNFVTLYRRQIGRPTPKIHCLEAHVVDFIRQHFCSWALAEEGGESVHHSWANVKLQTSHLPGYKRKYELMDEYWQRGQHPAVEQTFSRIMTEGRQRRPHNRKRQKFSMAQKTCVVDVN